MQSNVRKADRRQFLHGSGASALLLLTGLDGRGVFGQEDQRLSKGATGAKWAAATVHPKATDVAAKVLASGGNAMDAAIAASLMLSVVDGHNSGLGGGGFILLRTAEGQYHAIDGREMAPSAITPQHYYRDGKPDPSLSQSGPLAVGVPGLVAGLWKLSQEFGSTNWRSLVLPAAEMAQRGFRLGDLAKVIKRLDKEISRFPETARLLKPGGMLPDANHLLVQEELAKTLRLIAEQGADGFYKGETANLIADHLQKEGGVLSQQDMANYVALERKPIRSRYRQYQIIGFPPPSSGGVHVRQMLAMLEPFDLPAVKQRSEADYLHLLLEVMRRAMADRAHWLGDADFAKVPAGLLDDEYLKSRMQDFRFDQTSDQVEHGIPKGAESQFLGDRHTTHLTTADSAGNVVAITQTVNTSFGSKMIAPGTGVVLNNEMDDFAIAPGVRNAFGLLGTSANSIEAGKRPLSSMSPTIVADEQGHPVVTCGAAGGPRIITATLQNLLNVLDFKMTMPAALQMPRVHHQWSPNTAYVEQVVDKAVREDLKSRGHKVNVIQASATAQGISFADGMLYSGSEPRVGSKAAAG